MSVKPNPCSYYRSFRSAVKLAGEKDEIQKISFKPTPVARIFSAILMMWELLCIFPSPKHPIMAVSSEPMEPVFRPFNREPNFAGDIPVLCLSGCPLPMAHRAIQVSNNENMSGTITLL